MEFWDEWFRNRPLRRFFADLHRAFEEMFKEFASFMPKELLREQKLPDGTTIRTFGPVIYGYSLTVGPDGVPRIQTFGNVKPVGMLPRPSEIREPLLDIVESDKEVRVGVELPGVEKDKIELRATQTKLFISAEGKGRKYQKELELPSRVDPKSAKASYENGILEVTFQKLQESSTGEKIDIS